MKQANKIRATIALIGVVGIATLHSCSNKGNVTVSRAEIDSLRNQVNNQYAASDKIARNLNIFDTLDFTVFTNQQWTRLHESHSKDVIVHWPDGHITNGIEKHIADLQAMFVYAPNTSIKQHPIGFGMGNRTCVIGTMTGTFSAPMPIGGGNFIQPTGKSFNIPMCTVGIWQDGVMTEEYLFWDNQTFMNQIGLGK